MEKLAINTPQNVNIEYKLASLGDRLIAQALDTVVILLYSFALYLLFELTGLNMIDDRFTRIGITSLLSLPIFMYHLLSEIFLSGQSIGKIIMKIKVVRLDGGRASGFQYFIRWVFGLIEIYSNGGVIGTMAIILSRKSQRLGDMAAGTAVIKLSHKVMLSQTLLEELSVEYQPVFAQVRMLTDKDMNIIKKSFQEAQKSRNNALLKKLSEKIKTTLGIEQTDMNDFQFINTILKDHFYYHNEGG